MAKSTTTTKAKTKTTKKPAVKTASAKTTKSAAKTRAAKTTTKAKTTKKVTAVKSVAKTEAKKPVVTSTGFNRPFVLVGLAFAVLAGLAGFFMKGDSAQVFLGHLAKNELASRTSTVLASAAHPLYEIEFRWLVVVLLGVSAVFAILRGTRWQANETAGVKAGVQPLRWVDFAVTGALMYEIVALLNGLQDAVALKFGMFAVVLTAYFAWMYERENAATGKPARASLIGAQLAALVSVLGLAATLYGTYVYGMVRSPWYAYAALAAFVIWLASVVVRVKRTAGSSKQYYVNIDKAYNVQSVLVKVAFAVILIVGLYDKK